jgi:hypothetical protein
MVFGGDGATKREIPAETPRYPWHTSNRDVQGLLRCVRIHSRGEISSCDVLVMTMVVISFYCLERAVSLAAESMVGVGDEEEKEHSSP